MIPHNQDLKAGDTCLVVRCRTNPGYIGMSVELIKSLAPGERFDFPDASVGVMGVSNYKIWVVKGGPFTHKLDEDEYRSSYGSFAEHCLMKISGEPDQGKVLVGRVLDKHYRFMPIKGA